MKKREKRFEEQKEHKLKGTGIVISPQDILKALKKLAEILPDSGTEELTLAKTKVIAEKQKEVQTLRNPSFKPLQPTEIVDSLIYSPYRPNSLDEVLVKLEGLTAESAAQELIDTTNSLISLAIIEPLKSKIDSRKDFLKTTKDKLPLVTKLPNKPGGEDNILSLVENLKKVLKILLLMITNYIHNSQICFQSHYIF